jgi:hypothetical protein
VALAGQWLEFEQAAFGRFTAGSGNAVGAFLDHSIPLATGLAFALPAVRPRAAVLTDEGKTAPGHGNRLLNAAQDAKTSMRTLQEHSLTVDDYSER